MQEYRVLRPYGAYLWDRKKWYAQDSTSVDLTSTSFFAQPVTFLAFDPFANSILVEVPSGFYIQPRYEMTFTDNGAGLYTLSGIVLSTDDIDLMAANGVDVIDGPNILMADSENQTFEFHHTTRIGSKEPYEYRYIVDKYYR
ncbi:MAG TPA: hypothetical protein VEV83_20795 [Parafilimonas sp.]|nr:hypothetical protein [Parafilimonas sp.]